MSSSDDDDRIPECSYCGDDRGLCDRPHLEGGRRFSIKLDETFEVYTVHNDDKSFSVIKHDFMFLQRVISAFYNSTSASPAMQDVMSWRSYSSKIMRICR
jgi:hypothetical protein